MLAPADESGNRSEIPATSREIKKSPLLEVKEARQREWLNYFERTWAKVGQEREWGQEVPDALPAAVAEPEGVESPPAPREHVEVPRRECQAPPVTPTVTALPEGPVGPPGLLRFWSALLALDRGSGPLPTTGYAGLSVETGISIRRAHGYTSDLEDQGLLVIEPGHGSYDPNDRVPSRFHLSPKGRELAQATPDPRGSDRKVVIPFSYFSPPLIPTRERRTISIREILSRLSLLLDPLEDRWEGSQSSHLMARASLERGHPEVGPKEWAEWAGLSLATAKRVVAQMVEQGLAEKAGYGRYRCLVRVYILNRDWDDLMEASLARDWDNLVEARDRAREAAIQDVMFNLTEVVTWKRSDREDRIILATESNKKQGTKKGTKEPWSPWEIRPCCRYRHHRPPKKPKPGQLPPAQWSLADLQRLG